MENVYTDTVKITEDYLGPAADRFIERQVSFHLKKKPEELQKADLPKLTEWIKVSIALLTEDKKMVDECVGRLEQLAK